MKRTKKIDKSIFLYLIGFFIISTVSIYSSLIYLPNSMNDILIKQVVFYIIGFFGILIILKIGNEKIKKHSLYIYMINILLLIIVLVFGQEINGTKAWLSVPLFGTLQPSEFMKIGLILYLARIIENSRNKKEKEIILILKCIGLFFVPAFLTFLEPDTGAVIVYFIITLFMLITSGINKKWFFWLFFLFVLLIGILFSLYFLKQDLFIEIFGTNFFYRFDRIIDWQNSSGMQLKNSLIGISSSGIFGHGFNNIPIYFPELQTDFIFSSFVSCFGLFGGLLLIILFISFNTKLFNIAIKQEKENKLIVIGSLSAVLYQQIQNISMTIGLLPITGITLPFISSGGSSLLSFMILIGIVLNTTKKK